MQPVLHALLPSVARHLHQTLHMQMHRRQPDNAGCALQEVVSVRVQVRLKRGALGGEGTLCTACIACSAAVCGTVLATGPAHVSAGTSAKTVQGALCRRSSVSESSSSGVLWEARARSVQRVLHALLPSVAQCLHQALHMRDCQC